MEEKSLLEPDDGKDYDVILSYDRIYNEEDIAIAPLEFHAALEDEEWFIVSRDDALPDDCEKRSAELKKNATDEYPDVDRIRIEEWRSAEHAECNNCWEDEMSNADLEPVPDWYEEDCDEKRKPDGERSVEDCGVTLEEEGWGVGQKADWDENPVREKSVEDWGATQEEEGWGVGATQEEEGWGVGQKAEWDEKLDREKSVEDWGATQEEENWGVGATQEEEGWGVGATQEEEGWGVGQTAKWDEKPDREKSVEDWGATQEEEGWGVGQKADWGNESDEEGWGAKGTRNHDFEVKNWGGRRGGSSKKSEYCWGREKEENWDCKKEGNRDAGRLEDRWGYSEGRDTHSRDWSTKETHWAFGKDDCWCEDPWGSVRGGYSKEERNEDYWGVEREELDWGKREEDDWCVRRDREGRADSIWSWARDSRARLNGTKKTTGRRKRKTKVAQKLQTSDERKRSQSPDSTAVPNVTCTTKAAQKFQTPVERGRSQSPESTVPDVSNDSHHQIHSAEDQNTSSLDTNIRGQNILEYVVGILEKNCVELEAALNWVNARRQDAEDEDLSVTDKDLKTDIANLKKLTSDVKRSRKEVILCYSNMTGLTNKLPAESVALLDLTMELKDRAERVINIVNNELYGSEKGKFKEVFFKMMDRLGKQDRNSYLGAFCEMQTRMAKDHDVEEYIYEFMQEYKNAKKLKKTPQPNCSTST